MSERRRRDRKRERSLVSQEAAALLYTGRAREYKDAKEIVAGDLGLRSLPSNAEVALELRRYAEDLEGEKFFDRLERMREEALALLKLLDRFSPRLIGGVWRGILTLGSDIDIEVFSDKADDVKDVLTSVGFNITKSEIARAPAAVEEGVVHRFITRSQKDYPVEIIVKDPNAIKTPGRCEIFGDLKTGLSTSSLEELLGKNPTEMLVPKTRQRGR